VPQETRQWLKASPAHPDAACAKPEAPAHGAVAQKGAQYLDGFLHRVASFIVACRQA
jgi:hypothetical protein